MTAGRPRKPTALKILEGNRGKRKLNEAEPKPAPLKDLSAPADLDELSRLFWERYAPSLHADGLLTERDVAEFRAACQQHSLYERYTQRVLKHPFGAKAGDYGRRAIQALVQRDRILARFGMTPSDRTKVSVTRAPDDPFGAFLAGKQAK